MSTIKKHFTWFATKKQPNLFFLSWFDILDTFEFLLYRIYLIIPNNLSQMSVTLPFFGFYYFPDISLCLQHFLVSTMLEKESWLVEVHFRQIPTILPTSKLQAFSFLIHLMSKRERQMDFCLNKSDRKKLLSVRSHWHPAVRLADGPLRSQAAWGTERDTAAGGRSPAGRWRSSTGPDESGSQIGEYVQLTTHQYS